MSPFARALFVLLALSSAPAALAAGRTLPWISDDWPRAQAEARRRHVPIVVDTWAPW